MTTTIQQALNKLEHGASDFLKNVVEPALEAEWQAIKPSVIALGETTLSMIWAAATAYVTSLASPNPMTATAAVASVTAQLPAELTALEHLVMAAFAGAVQNISTKAAP